MGSGECERVCGVNLELELSRIANETVSGSPHPVCIGDYFKWTLKAWVYILLGEIFGRL